MVDAEQNIQYETIEMHVSRRLQVAMVGEGLAVGVVAGIVVTLYRMGLARAESLLRSITGGLLGWQWAAWELALVVLAGCVVALVRLVPDARGSGIPQVDAEVMGRLDMPWAKVTAAKFASGLLGTFAGLSLGREGPSVQLGGMAGKGVSRILGKERGEEHLLVTCGAAAGMSSAFHAPLTGVLFALEEIHREFNAPLVISAMAATVSADFVTSHVLGIRPILSFELVRQLPHLDYGLVLLMGIVCGVAGSVHNLGMFAIQDRVFGALKFRLGDAVILIPFLLAGPVAALAPQLMCGGDALIEVLQSDMVPPALAIGALLMGKYLYTSICFGSGAPGGTLMPLVVMGALLGALFAELASAFTTVPLAYLPNFVVLGIAGLFAGSVQAPVTAVVMCFELTGSLDTLLSATVVSLVAFVTANLLKADPFYEHLLDNLLSAMPASEPTPELEGKKVLHSHVIGVGSLAEGKAVQDVPWPRNTLLVTLSRAGQDVIPRGTTRLQALDEILVIMDADLEADTELLMRGICGGRVTAQGSDDVAEAESQS